MKIIKYQLMTEINHGTEEEPYIVQTFSEKTMGPMSDDVFDSNYAVAQREAYGEITVEEVPDPEPEPTPSGDLETRVAAVEHDVADLTDAVEKGLSL